MQCPAYSPSVLDFSINKRGNCKLEKEEDKAKKRKSNGKISRTRDNKRKNKIAKDG